MAEGGEGGWILQYEVRADQWRWRRGGGDDGDGVGYHMTKSCREAGDERHYNEMKFKGEAGRKRRRLKAG